jgi:hypothetical protein
MRGTISIVPNGPCEIHEWPDEGLPAAIVLEARRRYVRGGRLVVCDECIDRAHRQIQPNEKLEEAG